MKRRVLLAVSVLLILSGIFLLIKIVAATIAPKGKGALQVTSNIKAQVYLNQKPIGETPLCRCEQNETLKEGEYDIKIVPDDKDIQPFSAKVKINPGVLTAVDRTFLPGALASYYILALEKTDISDPQIFVASIPDGSLVSIDGESSGITPLTIKKITSSEHEVEIQKQGFAKKTVRIRAVPSYKLVLNVLLGTETELEESQEKPTSTSAPAPTKTQEKTVEIKTTPTGFLRVREEPSTSSREIGRVNPGETFSLLDENETWLQIELENGTKGWVSKTYAEIKNQ